MMFPWKRRPPIFRVVSLFLLLTAGSAIRADGRQVALVIGNGAYQKSTVSRLVNPANDANDVSEVLRSIGFEVQTVIDGTREEMGLSIERFSNDLLGADVGLFFYAGHGVQVDGTNYLIPVDADLPNSNVVKFRAIAADEVLAFMEAAGSTLNLFLLDACRDNPLPQATRTLARGLAAVTHKPPETMIVYATAADDVAADGTGANSPFTRALVKHLPTPGLDVYDLYRNVSSDVQSATGGAQRPELFGNVTGRYTLVAPSDADPSPLFQVELGSVRVTTRAPATIFLDEKKLAQSTTAESHTISDIEVGIRTLVARYGDGSTESKTARVSSTMAVEVDFEYGFGSIRVVATTGGIVYLDGSELAALSTGQSVTKSNIGTGLHNVEFRYPNGRSEMRSVLVVANETIQADFAGFGTIRVTAATGGVVYIDSVQAGEVRGDTGELFVGIPAGSRSVEVRYADGERETHTVSVQANGVAAISFRYEERPDNSQTAIRDEIFVEGGTFSMGSPSDGAIEERPMHQVSLDSFFMMKTEVTFNDYEAFARATGGDLPNDVGYGRGSRPVIKVSWFDAVAYANWLSGRDGFEPAYQISGANVTWNASSDGWRLPTEAEWEYAARGGKSARDTLYAGSDDVASVAWYLLNSGMKTQPVALKEANELGLYDMSGNVWEWCWDWKGLYGSNSQRNPTGPGSGTHRVVRGGSWNSTAWYTRGAYRDYVNPVIASYNYGFRLVRRGSL